MDGRQIGPLDSTVVARMSDKSAELTVHAKIGLDTTNLGKIKTYVYLY